MITVPHIPACCPACYALLSPAEKQIAMLVLKMIQAPSEKPPVYYMPNRVPLCQRED